MEQIKVDLIPGRAIPVCHASQYDKGRTIRVNLTQGLSQNYILDGTEDVTINVRKVDGNLVVEQLSVVEGKSYIDFSTTEQMTACYGSNTADIIIKKDDVEIGTMNFILEVEKDPRQDGVVSTSAIYNLEVQIREINESMVPDMVAEQLATQYDSENVVFDNTPTDGHNSPYTVTSAGIKAAIEDIDVNDLHDATISSPADGQVLQFNGNNSKWINKHVNVENIHNVNIDSETLANGDSLIYSSTDDKWINGEGGKKTLAELNDVNIDEESLADGDAIVYDEASEKWINAEAGKKNLVELNDVDIDEDTLAADQCLIYDAENDKWINGEGGGKVWQGTQAQYDALTETDPDVVYYITDGQEVTCNLVELTQEQYDAITTPDPNTWYFITDGEEIVCDLGDLDDVTISSASNGDVLAYNNGAWVNSGCLEFQKGDTFNLENIWCCGYQGNSSTRAFFIPLPKEYSSSLTVSVTAVISAYTFSGASETWNNNTLSSLGTVSYLKARNGVVVLVALTTPASTTQYTPLTVRIASGTLTFS